MGAYFAAHHLALVIALVAGAFVVPALGPQGTYAVGGAAGVVGTALLLPLLRHLPSDRRPDRPAGRDVEVEATPT
jgi:hypothetical protein